MEVKHRPSKDPCTVLSGSLLQKNARMYGALSSGVLVVLYCELAQLPLGGCQICSCLLKAAHFQF